MFRFTIPFCCIVLALFFLCCKGKNYHKGKCEDWHTIKEPVVLPDSLKHLTFLFDDVLNNDRVYRCSPDPDYFLQHVKEQEKLDSFNQIFIWDILKKYGFKGPKQIGYHGYYAVTKVVQHSKRKMQEKIYPLYVMAFNDSCMDGEDLAMFEDRINVHRKRKQYFGTQIQYNSRTKEYIIYPLYNVDSVNIYRKQIGLYGTLEEYLMNSFKIKWDAVEYKKQLPALMKKLGFSDSAGVNYNKELPYFIKVDSSLLK